MYLHSVAPRDLIRADHEALRSYEKLETTPEIEDLILAQSLEGRAHNGSGMFNKRCYVNTTIDDVVRALDLNPDDVKRRRQAVIDDIREYVTSTLNGERRDRLINRQGEPLMGFPMFLKRRVNPRDVLRGLYLGGLRDNPEIRKETERIYQTKIGCGRCYIIDVKTMLEMRLDGEILAHESHEDKIDEYTRRGLIVDTEGAPDPKTQRYFYIRHRIGPGQTDDGALIFAGILYNVDVAIGVFLADAIDTLEKYAPVFRDQDGALSFEIARGFKELQMTQEDVYELASLSAIPELEEHLVPDSSLRYLLSIDPRSQQSALQNHFDFVDGKPIVSLPVGFRRILSTDFYAYINRRLINIKKFEKYAVPNLTVKELDRPVAEFAKKDFCTIAKDATLADVVRKFKETKSEIMIVQDKNNRVIGTVAPSDLLHLLEGDGAEEN